MKRFEQYCSALEVLERADQQDLSNEFVLSGIIDKFALQFELAWKMLKDALRYEGYKEAASGSPRDILKASFKLLDCIDENDWLSILGDRNEALHIYDAERAREIVDRILANHIPAFVNLREGMRERYDATLEEIA